MPKSESTITRTGYSGKSVAEKLGLKPEMRMVLLDPPADYWDLIEFNADQIKVRCAISGSVDLIHAFVMDASQLTAHIRTWGEAIRPSGMLWVSWPKKASGVKTDVTEDTIRNAALSVGLVDIKVCSVSPIWSGLKLVWRKRKQ